LEKIVVWIYLLFLKIVQYREENLKNQKPLFYHYVASNGLRGFTICGVVKGEHLYFGIAIKHPTGDKNYIKRVGRHISFFRAESLNGEPYKKLIIGKRKPSTIFYKEVNRIKDEFENISFFDYEQNIKFIKKYKAINPVEKKIETVELPKYTWRDWFGLKITAIKTFFKKYKK
jgi:hypothetical protein